MSRVLGNLYARFLGGNETAMPLPYPTMWIKGDRNVYQTRAIAF
ncbi:MAG: hypothetical protein AB3A66_28490 (plasmid) [Nodularia sp. CChRGM 3473]